jgi:hypothetical protein
MPGTGNKYHGNKLPCYDKDMKMCHRACSGADSIDMDCAENWGDGAEPTNSMGCTLKLIDTCVHSEYQAPWLCWHQASGIRHQAQSSWTARSILQASEFLNDQCQVIIAPSESPCAVAMMPSSLEKDSDIPALPLQPGFFRQA